MASSQGTMDYLLGQLGGAGPVGSRRMFGEFCLYYDGRPIGLVCNDQLYLKPSELGRRLMREPREGAPFPGARPHLLVTADDWEDRHWLAQMVRATFDSLPPPKPVRAKVVARPEGAAARSPASLAMVNIGPRSREMLKDAGVDSFAALVRLGSVAAYVKVRRLHSRASLNLLWALEGALCGLPWQEVARQHRTSLLLALEQAQAQESAAKTVTRGKKTRRT